MITMTQDQIINELKSLYGNEITTNDVNAYCAMHDVSYPTITRRLEQYKTSRGRWNLDEKVQEIETAFNAPSVVPDQERVCLLYTSPSPRDS